MEKKIFDQPLLKVVRVNSNIIATSGPDNLYNDYYETDATLSGGRRGVDYEADYSEEYGEDYDY